MGQSSVLTPSRGPSTSSVRITSAFWILTDDTYTPTTARADATHVLEDDGAGTYTMTAIGDSVNPARAYLRGDTYFVRGAA